MAIATKLWTTRRNRSGPMNISEIARAIERAALAEREACKQWFRSKPGTSYVATLRDIDEYIRSRGTP